MLCKILDEIFQHFFVYFSLSHTQKDVNHLKRTAEETDHKIDATFLTTFYEKYFKNIIFNNDNVGEFLKM